MIIELVRDPWDRKEINRDRIAGRCKLLIRVYNATRVNGLIYIVIVRARESSYHKNKHVCTVHVLERVSGVVCKLGVCYVLSPDR